MKNGEREGGRGGRMGANVWFEVKSMKRKLPPPRVE